MNEDKEEFALLLKEITTLELSNPNAPIALRFHIRN